MGLVMNVESNEYHTARKAVLKVQDLRELNLLKSIIDEMQRSIIHKRKRTEGKG